MNPKIVQSVAIGVMLAIGAAYMFYLLKSWEQMQHDRQERDEKINALLDRFPKVSRHESATE